MNILFYDGFDIVQNFSLNNYNTNNAFYSNNCFRSGSHAAVLTFYQNENAFIEKIINNTFNGILVGFTFNFKNSLELFKNQPFFILGDSQGNRQFIFKLNNENKVIVINGGSLGNNSILSTAPYPVGINGWYFLQVRYYADSVNGYITAKIGETEILNITNQNLECYNNIPNYILIGSKELSTITNEVDMYVDDLYVCGLDFTDNYIGLCSVIGRVPVQDQTPFDFTAYFANDVVQAVNELVPNRTNWIWANIIDDQAWYSLSSLASLGNILSTKLFLYLRRTPETENTVTYEVLLRNHMDSTYVIGNYEIETSYWTPIFITLEKNPFTNQPWTQEELNSVHVGVKILEI